MANTHTGNVQPTIDYEEHARIGGLDGKKTFLFDNAGNQITSFGALATVNINGAVNANVSLGASAQYIGLTTVDIGTNNTVKSVVSLSNSVSNIGFATVNVANIINANVSLNASDKYIGLVTNTQVGLTTLAPSPNYIGLTTAVIGNTPNANVSLGASAQFIGIVTVTNRDRTITGNLTLSDAKTYVGLTTSTIGNALVTTSLIGNVTLSDSKGFIGLVTAVSRNAGTTKTLIPKNISMAPASIATIIVPSNTFYMTSLILNSNATAGLRIKSGATYLIGNVSISVSLNPGGGWVQHGAPDSPIYQGLAGAAAIVVEKEDFGGVVAEIAGHLMYFDE